MTGYGKQYGAIVMVLADLMALTGVGQAQQQEITGKDGAPVLAGEFGMGSNEAVLEKPVGTLEEDKSP